MIYTTYFAQLRNLPKNIIPISICAKAPSWYNGLQYKKNQEVIKAEIRILGELPNDDIYDFVLLTNLQLFGL